MDELSPGHRLGSYRIRRTAGRGAVGIVYQAEHTQLGTPAAIKTLSPAYAREPVFRERFSREAQGAAAVDHPNIISVFDVGEQDGLPYLVMTYVEGPDLERVLIDRGGRIEPAEAVLICAAVAEALDAAARQGLAHRDVKPANILLEGWQVGPGAGRRQRRPHVYLTDFGLIKSSAQARVTQTGQFVGTLLYMAPEQIESRAVPASDQYSLACVLWECLTGTFPFEPVAGSTFSLMTAHISQPVPRISERPGGSWSAALDDVFFRALAKRPEDRFDSCTAFMDAATRALGLGTAAPPVTPAPPRTALEHTQIIPISPPLPEGGEGGGAGEGGGGGGGGEAAGGVASGAAPRPDRAGDGGQPADSTVPTPIPPAAPGAGGPPIPAPLPGGADVRRTSGGTPAALPEGLGRHGPAGLSHHPAPPQGGTGGRRGVAIGIAVLLLLVLAVVAALLVFDGGGDAEAGAGEADPTADEVADAEGAAADAEDGPAADGADRAPLEQQGRIAVVTDDGIHLAHADGSGAAAAPLDEVPEPLQPAWRPGEEALLVSSADGLRLVDLGTGEVTAITDDPADSDPAWSPDGRRIAFSRPADGGGRDLVVADADGGAATPLDVAGALGDGAVAQRPAWSPDGEAIAFQVSVDDELDIALVPADGGAAERYAGEDGARDFHPAWMPGGDLLFTSARTGTPQLWRRDAATGAERQVTDVPGGALDGDPSPCGDWVAYALEVQGTPRVGYAEVDGEGEPALLPLPEGAQEASDPAWAGQTCPTG